MKKSIIFAIIAFLAGVLLVMQYRSFKKVELLVARSSPGDVLQELRVFQVANQDLRELFEEEKKAYAELQTKLANVSLEEEMARLRLISGQQPVQGEGIELTFNEPISEFWISDLIAELVLGGAEAIALNDIRVTAETAGFRTVAGGLLMRSTFHKTPLRMVVIGPRKALREAVAHEAGLIDRIEDAHPGLKILLAEREKIVIPALP